MRLAVRKPPSDRPKRPKIQVNQRKIACAAGLRRPHGAGRRIWASTAIGATRPGACARRPAENRTIRDFASRTAQPCADDLVEDRGAERAAEVVAALAPVEAAAAQRAPAAAPAHRRRCRAWQRSAGRCSVSRSSSPRRAEQRAVDQAVEHLHRQIAGEMVVAGARAAQFGIARTGAHAHVPGARGDRHQSFERGDHVGIGEAEIAVPPLPRDRRPVRPFPAGQDARWRSTASGPPPAPARSRSAPAPPSAPSACWRWPDCRSARRSARCRGRLS